MAKKPRVLALLIDLQNDFIKRPGLSIHTPSLPVPKAFRDIERIVKLLSKCRTQIWGMTVTLDSHHDIDIAHHTQWTDADGRILAAFTEVTAEDVKKGNFIYKGSNLKMTLVQENLVEYLEELEAKGKKHMLFPPHCIIGTPGHNLFREISDEVRAWEQHSGMPVTFVQKGECIWTESFSALRAAVPHGNDPATYPNYKLLSSLEPYDRILVMGQASSHCVKETVLDILNMSGKRYAEKITLLTDCMSPVQGHEDEAEQFFKTASDKGVKLSTADEVISELTSTIE